MFSKPKKAPFAGLNMDNLYFQGKRNHILYAVSPDPHVIPIFAEVGGCGGATGQSAGGNCLTQSGRMIWVKAFFVPPERFTARASYFSIFLVSTPIALLLLAWLSSNMMMPLRPSKSALRSIHIQRQLACGRRPFSTSFVASAASPHRSSPQKRAQSTATAAP